MPDLKDEEIRFRPLSEGLGLNHFADGLPYSSSSILKGRRTMHQFNFPPPRAASTTAQTTPLRPELTVDLEADANTETTPVYAEPESAGFIRRLFAFAVDFSLTVGFYLGLLYVGFYLNGFDVSDLMRSSRAYQFVAPLALLYVVVYLGYFLVQEITWKRTIGKAIVGIRIRSNSAFAVLGRVICFFVAALPLGIGLLWYFFDSRHRCWHDVITDSEVVLG